MLSIIRNNLVNAMQRDGIPSGNALAKLASIDQKTVTSILSKDAAPNPTLKVITALSKALRLEPWMLLVPNMPLDKVSSKRLKTISSRGYRLLQIFDESPEHTQASILDFAAYNLKSNAKATSKVGEIRAEYGCNPSDD